ncbi:hypothetical protein, partial [Streptomyces sp. NPDC003483]
MAATTHAPAVPRPGPCPDGGPARVRSVTPGPSARAAMASADRIGYEDHGLEGIEYVESLKPLIAG